MKKLIMTCILCALTLNTLAIVVQYKDVVNDNKHDGWLSNQLQRTGITLDTTSEIKDLKFAHANKLIKLANARPELTAEIDDFVAATDAKYIWEKGVAIVYHISDAKTRFPKWFEYGLSTFDKTPVTQSVFAKYGVLKFTDQISANDLIACINAGEFKYIHEIDHINTLLKNKGVKIIKKYLRSVGKSFVVQKKKIDGKDIEINPLEIPMKELTDALNSARYAGFNEWSTKYDAKWNAIDLKWLQTDEQMKNIMDDILIDEKKLNDYVIALRFHLGVEGFNAFIKLYNEGAAE